MTVSPLPKSPHDRVWRSIARHLRDHGKSPTVRNLMDQLGKSNGSIQNSRKWLAKQGFIALEKGKPGIVLQIWPQEITPPDNLLPRFHSQPGPQNSPQNSPQQLPQQSPQPVLPGVAPAKTASSQHHLHLVPAPQPISEPLPIQGEIAAGALFEPATETQEYLDLDYAGRRADDFVLRVSGQSMVGDCIPDGAFVVMRPTPDGYEPRPGEIVAVWVEGAGTTLKHFYQEKQVVVLESSNPEVPPQMIDTTELAVQVQATHLLTHWRSRFSS
jgi:SOS-response transcriptional repressor LexA